MAKDFTKIAAVMIFTNNLIKSANWYCKLMEIDPKRFKGKTGITLLTNPRLIFHLPSKKSPISNGGSVTYWKVKDFDKTLEKAVKLKATVHRGPIEVKEFKIKIAQFKDPFGGVFGIEGKL